MKTLLPHHRTRGGDGSSVNSAGLGKIPESAPSHSRQTLLRKVRQSSRRKDLHASVADGAAFSVMVGIGETYLPAFALALGMGEIAAGLIASIPLLAGAFLQLISPWAVRQLGSNRRWVITCVMLQASSFLPLVAGALWGSLPTAVVFLVASLYWGAGLGAGPAWNTWIETVVPWRVRAPFFAWRTRLSQTGVLVGFVGGGLSLQYGKDAGKPLVAFAVIFAVAAFCRFLSARYLSFHSEPKLPSNHQKHVSLGELIGRIREGRSERLLLYFLAVQVAVQISGPYFTPYILGQMKVSYIEFMMLLAVSFVGKILVLPACGRFAHRFGARRLLWVGGIGIVPVAGLWLYAETFMQIVLIQLIAGVVWAAYELAMLLMFFETVRREERTSVLTMFNFGNSLALVIGALSGGFLLKTLGECREAYLTLFAASSAVRALTLIVLQLAPAIVAQAVKTNSEPRPGSAPVFLPEPATVSAPSE